MREFSVSLTKTLAKGLAPFPKNESQELGLRECFNLMPSPSGLVEHEAIRSTGWKGPIFNYLPIKDQNGILWYWYPIFNGGIVVGSTIPSAPTTGMYPVSVVPAPVWWVEIIDQAGMAWQMYPSIVTGLTFATDSQLPVGFGVKDMIWRGTTGEDWMIKFNSVTHQRISVKV